MIPEQIVKTLAAMKPPAFTCQLCGVASDVPSKHKAACPWRQAREWATHPPKPVFPDPKLTPYERRQHADAVRHRDRIILFLTGDPKAKLPRQGLTDAVLGELLRRGREPAQDAYTGAGGGAGNEVKIGRASCRERG